MSGLPAPVAVRRAKASLCVAVILLLAVACGGSDGKVIADGAGAKDKTLPTLATATTLPDVKGKPCKAAVAGKKVAGKPVVKMPVGKPPTKLVREDLKVGTGAVIKAGDTVTVQYVGVSCSSGQQFDATWDKDPITPFSTALTAASGVIKGWVQGIPGMKVGGRRQLVIPPDLAYGPEGRGGIARNETLVFVIDLLDNKAPPPTTTTVPASSTTAPKAGASTTVTTGGSTTTTVPGKTTNVPSTTIPSTTTKG